MTSFPGSPRTLRGAIVAVDPLSPRPRAVVFQYNPDTVARTLRPRTGGGGQQQAAAADAHRIWGAPVETVSMTIDVDATDQLEAGDPVAAASGITPQLALLELLLYPSSALVTANTLLLLTGTIEILPPESPLTILVWGPGRAVPVRLDGLTVTEKAFDTALFPTRAEVELSLQVLTYSDLPAADPGSALFLVHQVLKETMAAVAAASGAATAVAGVAGA